MMNEGNSANCNSCRNSLGGGCCRINLEKECAAGGYEAWQPKTTRQPAGKAMLISEILTTYNVPRHILGAAMKAAGVRPLSGGGRAACTYDSAEIRAALESYYSKRIDWLRGKCNKECRIWQDRWDELKRGDNA